MAKILILDIETSPNMVYTWGLWNQNIGLNQIIKPSEVICFAYSWFGSDEVKAISGVERNLIKPLMKLLDEADIIVAHNADRFDLPRIRALALKLGVYPPSPFKVVDTLKVARRQFKFESNRLDFLAEMLGVKPKGNHKEFPGFELWLEYMNGNPKAREAMEEYNINDVETLEDIYLKMLPWIDNHPNIAVMAEQDTHVCPKCGSKELHRRGFAYTNVGKYQRYRCTDCGGWSRTRFTEYDPEKRRALLVHAVN